MECQGPSESPSAIEADSKCFKECITSEDCGESAVCDSASTTGAGDRKVCFDICKSNGECEDGEVCATWDAVSVFGIGLCIKRDIVESNPIFEELESAKTSPVVENVVCVDAAAVRHLQPEELVFARQVIAPVLCDKWGSCATAGHIVRYKGVGMMMKRYCGMVGCVRQVLAVNSPRYKVGLRLLSKTEGLEYTALAARYESVVEERVLSTFVRLGF